MHLTAPHRALGVSLLAIGAFAATIASTAHADWTITSGESSPLHIVISGRYSLGVVRTPFLKIHCESNNNGTALIQLSNDHKTSAVIVDRIAICTEQVLSACTVSSPGFEPGEIHFEASGPMAAKEGTIYATLEDEEIAAVEYSGEECLLDELILPLSGSMTFKFVDGEKESSTHLVELDENKLFLGEEKAFLDGEKEAGAIGAEFEAEGKAPFAIGFTE